MAGMLQMFIVLKNAPNHYIPYDSRWKCRPSTDPKDRITDTN